MLKDRLAQVEAVVNSVCEEHGLWRMDETVAPDGFLEAVVERIPSAQCRLSRPSTMGEIIDTLADILDAQDHEELWLRREGY